MRMVKYHETRAGSLWMDTDRLRSMAFAYRPEMGRERYEEICAEHGVEVRDPLVESGGLIEGLRRRIGI